MTNTDATLTTVGGAGVFWYSARQFSAYSLKLDWRLPGDDDSGVFVGFSSGATAGSTGYEVQIDATNVANGTTGSVWGAKGVDVAARDAALNPPGAWNTYELLVQGERLQIFLNGPAHQRLHQHRSQPQPDLRLHRPAAQRGGR